MGLLERADKDADEGGGGGGWKEWGGRDAVRSGRIAKRRKRWFCSIIGRHEVMSKEMPDWIVWIVAAVVSCSDAVSLGRSLIAAMDARPAKQWPRYLAYPTAVLSGKNSVVMQALRPIEASKRP